MFFKLVFLFPFSWKPEGNCELPKINEKIHISKIHKSFVLILLQDEKISTYAKMKLLQNDDNNIKQQYLFANLEEKFACFSKRNTSHSVPNIDTNMEDMIEW